MKYLVTDRNDEIQGPYTLEEIRNLLSSGGIDAGALSCEEGSEKWQPLISILPPVPPVKSGTAPVKSPSRPETPVQKPEVNATLVIFIVVIVALLSLIAYFIGRKL